MREDGAWFIDASVAVDDAQRTALVVARPRALPGSWTLVAEAPIRLDGLGNYGHVEGGALLDRSGIERLVFTTEMLGDEVSDSTNVNSVQAVDALVSATQSPLTVPHLLTSIAQLMGVVGSSPFAVHPAVAGLGPVHDDPSAASTLGLWRAPFLDAIVGESSTLVLTGFAGEAEVVELSGSAARIWAAVDGRDAESTVRRVLGESAEQQEWAEHRRAVRDLRDRGLIREEPSWRCGPEVAWVDGGDYAALISSSGTMEAPLMLAGSAYSVWRRLCADQATSFDDLVLSVAADYGLEVHEIANDVRGLLEQLLESAAVVHV